MDKKKSSKRDAYEKRKVKQAAAKSSNAKAKRKEADRNRKYVSDLRGRAWMRIAAHPFSELMGDETWDRECLLLIATLEGFRQRQVSEYNLLKDGYGAKAAKAAVAQRIAEVMAETPQ